MTPFVEPQPTRVTSASGGPMGGVREFVANEYAIFVVLVRRCGMGVPGHTRNRPRGDPAFGNFVAFVTIRFLRWISGDDHLASIDLGIEVELFGIHRRPAFREQQVAENDSRTLETVGEVVHFGNEFETIRNVRWRGNESWKVAESRAQHLP